MELKDVVLSTLAEIQEPIIDDEKPQKPSKQKQYSPQKKQTQEVSQSDEVVFLESLRERLLVLFEGFGAPNNANIEAKVDLTLNFLEYVLSSIDERLQRLKK